MGNFFISHFLPLLSGPITGYIVHFLMEYVDDGLKLTAKLPDSAKQAVVLLMSAIIPAINQQFNLVLPTDITQFATQPVIQMLVASAVAFFLKHTQAPSTGSVAAAQ